MAILWIGIAIGILIAIILIAKYLKTPSQEVLRLSQYCQKCGFKTNGLKCPRCNYQNKSKY